MKRRPDKRKFSRPKTKLGLPDLDQSKAAVLGSLRSPESRRGYRHAIDEFIEWYCSEPRLSLNRTVVMRYRNHLESRSLAPGTINVRLGRCAEAGLRGGRCRIIEPRTCRWHPSREGTEEARSMLGKLALGRWGACSLAVSQC